MTKPSPLSDDDLKALTDAEMRAAVQHIGGKLSAERRKAMVYYLGLPEYDLTPPEIEGRSKVVSTDVRNTILSMMPQLMAKFVGGDQVVEFQASQPDDEDKAKSCTDYLNYLFFKKNNGHAICSTWFLDALLQKRGFLKIWWDTRAEEKREEYKGLTEIELAQIMDDPEVEAIEQTTYPDEEDAKHRQDALEAMGQQLQQAMQAAQPNPQAPQGNPKAMQAVQQLQAQIAHIQAQPPAMLYDVAFKRSLKAGKIAINNVPPEEFLISREAKSIETARFVGHRVPRTLSELRSMGYKNVDDIASDGDGDLNEERLTRDQQHTYIDDNSGDKSQRIVWVTECYIRCDYDGDGIAELRKVVRAGNQILDNEEVDCAPFVSICPVPLSHMFYGLSVADLAMESQRTKTNILRAQLDNMYLQVNGRYFAVEGQVNLDDLMYSRPGGVVRIKNPNAVGRLDQGHGDGGASTEMMAWMEENLEQSTGWTRYSQGNDSKALNQTATGVQIITGKGDMRVDLIARNFAEGFVDLFRMMLKLVSQHQDKKTQINVNGQWVDMDPREWRNQFDVNINVGLGIGSKDEQVQKLMGLAQQQANAMAIGVSNPKNVYELHVDMAELMGFKNAEKYFNDPEKNPPPPRPDPEAAKMQGQLQIEQMKLQAQNQSKQAELQANAQIEQVKAQYAAQEAEAKRNYEAQLEQARMQMQAEVDNNRQRAEAEQHTLKIQQEAQLAQLKLQNDDAAHQREMAFKWEVAQLEAATKIQVANIASKAKLDDAATQAATAEVSADVTQ
ncbi:hypothetical protein RD110_10955 [Rhodoferax koreense]|uniref:Portal protein n=1 Tax=Rhodoferax koreensis TaxID=1842727 RepID=A0A1P8JV43_9BURK|nr:hypothetical protein [Rhodoferax koreense]APW37646.1 hypothetical protein RD110_10955 [Rhodoferax koreense]